MNILAVGINHKTSSIDIREKFYLQPIERELLLSDLKNDPRIVEAFVLSTCNRVEIYAHAIENDAQILIDAIFKVKKIQWKAYLYNHFYIFTGKDAVNHLLRVTTGLDSLIIGEKQILGQVKEAFEFSTSKGMMNKTFNILSNLVLQTGKKARNETQIDFGGSSISWAAVNMAQDILGSLENKVVLVLGCGKMGRLAINQLTNKGVRSAYIMNRTHEKAQEIAQETNAIAVGFWEMKDILQQADVCICSSGAPHYLIGRDLVCKIMEHRKGRRLVCIDISMPRNIDPEISYVEDVSLVTVDDLDKVVEDNIQKRLSAVGIVEGMIVKKIDEFYQAMEKVLLTKQISQV